MYVSSKAPSLCTISFAIVLVLQREEKKLLVFSLLLFGFFLSFPKNSANFEAFFWNFLHWEKPNLKVWGVTYIYLNHIHPLYACCCCYIYLYLLYHWDSSGYMRKICYCWANNTKLRLFSLSYWPGICLLYAIVSSQLILY